MMRLKRYLKPFLLGIALAIALLFVQAISDLSLPNYMSDIVNVGIQQSGVEHAAPDFLSAEAMAGLQPFFAERDASLIAQSYTLDADGRHQLNDAGIDARDALDLAYGRAAYALLTASGGELSADAIDPSAIEAAKEKALTEDEQTLRQSGIQLTLQLYRAEGVDTAAIERGYILKVGLMMLLVALIGGVATVLVSLLSSRIAAGFSRDLRQAVFEKIESFSSAEFDKFSTASLITRTTNDVTQVQMLITMGIRMICYAPIMAIGGVIMALNKSVSMSWIIAVACALLLGLILIILAVAMPRFKVIQKLVDRLNLVARENLNGLLVIRAFSAEKHEMQRFDDANKELTDTNLFVNRVMALMMPLMSLIMNGMTVLIVWVGAGQIAASAMQVGDIMAYIQYVMQIIMAFLMISMMFIMVPRAAVSAERIADVLETEPTIRDPEKPVAPDADRRGTVVFDNVSFHYAGAEAAALSNITFTALPGQTTAIIGPTGSGKSTILNLIVRFYDVTRGKITFDGVDVRQMTQESLRARIGYVPQKGVLLSGTIDSNLRYGVDDADEATIQEAARIAQAADFIEEKPNGYQSEIAQGGTNVSGGQKQRLSIARALVKDPEVYLFDDSFSALDFKTDATLRAALKPQTKDAAVIVVAQRVSTIMDADQILVLDEGEIVGRGTHRELLKSCPQYLEIASSQMGSEATPDGVPFMRGQPVSTPEEELA